MDFGDWAFRRQDYAVLVPRKKIHQVTRETKTQEGLRHHSPKITSSLFMSMELGDGNRDDEDG